MCSIKKSCLLGVQILSRGEDGYRISAAGLDNHDNKAEHPGRLDLRSNCLMVLLVVMVESVWMVCCGQVKTDTFF